MQIVEMQKSPSCSRCSGLYVAKATGRIHKRPLLLHCGHTFCESCVIQLSKELKTSLICPTCSQETTLSEGEDGWKGLIPNRYIVGLVLHSQKVLLDQELNKLSPAGMMLTQRKRTLASGDSQSISCHQSVEDKLCSGCMKRQAISRCDKCDCIMCHSCFENIHKMSNTLRQHKAVPLTEDSYSQLEMSQTCKFHENRPVEYYCEDDDAIICSRCVIVGDHRGHNISSIEDKNKLIVSEMEPSLQIANHVNRRLNKIEKDRSLSVLIPDMKTEVTPALEELARHFQYLHGVLQIREQALQKDVIAAFQQGIDPVENLIYELQEERKKLDLTIKAAQRIINNNDEVIVNAKEIMQQLQHARDIPCVIELTEKQNTSEKISFLPGTPVDEMLLQHGQVAGTVQPSFTMYTLRDKPEKFTEDSESLGSTTPADNVSQVSTVSEDVIIEEEQEIIFDDNSSRVSDESCRSDRSKKSKKKSTKVKTILKRTRVKGHLEKVIVTHIHNPCQFVVQQHSDSYKLSTLSNSMNDWCNRPIAGKHVVTGVDTDDLVLCRYSRDKQWYRARIKNVMPSLDDDFNNTTVEVLYIDYGNTEIVPVNRLRNMQPRFMKHPQFALECCLFDIVPTDKSGCWSADAVQTFAKMVENKPLLLSVMREDNSILQVDLSKPPDEDIIDDRPVSVRDALVFLELAHLESPQSIPITGGAPAPSRNFLNPEPATEGQQYDVVVSYAGTPDCFYAQELGEESHYLANMMAQMQETYKKEMRDSWQLLCPQIGMICVSQFTGDGMWYRARVVGLPGNKLVDVLYVDYGNVERVTVYSLRKIIDTYLILPSQAIRCRLTDVDPHNINEGWAQEALRFWSELVTMKKFVMKVTVLGPTLSVVLREPEVNFAYSINMKMVEAGHGRSVGKWSEPSHYDDSQLEAGMAAEVPRLTYNQGNASFPQLAKPGSYQVLRNPSRTHRAQPTVVLTPPSSPPPSRGSPTDTGKTAGMIAPEKLSCSSVKQKESSPKTPVKKSTSTSEAGEKTPAKKAEKKAEIEVVISHFQSPSQFQVQLASAGDDGLDQLMSDLADKFRNSEPTFVSWAEDNYCAALSSQDHRWYRAKILKTVQSKLYEVVMVDYGFTEFVPGTNLRKMGKTLRHRNCFSFTCHLADLIPAGGIKAWSKTACEFMQEKTAASKLYISKKGNAEDKSLPIDLILEEYIEETALEPGRKTYTSLIDVMKERGLAIPLRSKSSKKKAEEPPESFPAQYYKKGPAITQTSLKILPVYVDYDAVIYFYTMGGDMEFQSLCTSLHAKFNLSDPHGTSQTWQVGQGCVCYYRTDQAWCRANILALEPHRAQVHYVDFGNSEWVAYDKLRADIEEFTDLPIQTFQCVLHDLNPMTENEKWSEPVLEYLHKELVNKYCHMEVVEYHEDKPLSVKLRRGDKDVATHLVQYGMAERGVYITDQEIQSRQIRDMLQKNCPYKQSQREPVGEKMPVLITHVELPNVVYVQHTRVEIEDSMDDGHRQRVERVNKQLDQLVQLAVDINKVAPSLPSIPMPKPGLACCAQFGFDHCWYRALIVDTVQHTEHILVLFVDYGNSEFVTVNKIRALPPKYQSLPCQGVRCVLKDIVPPAGCSSWTKQSLMSMMTILANKPILAEIKGHSPVLSVDLYEMDGESRVYQSVLDAGHVQHSIESSLYDAAVCGGDVEEANYSIITDEEEENGEECSESTTSDMTKTPSNWADIVQSEVGSSNVSLSQNDMEFDTDNDPDVVIEEEVVEVSREGEQEDTPGEEGEDDIGHASIMSDPEECFD